MTTTHWKATRPNGTDFRTGTVDYGAALLSGEVVKHPLKLKVSERDVTTWEPCVIQPGSGQS